MVNRVFDMYRDIKLGDNKTCSKCKKSVNSVLFEPASLWNVGEKYEFDQYKVMFVGKPVRGTPGTKTEDGFLDCREIGREFYYEKSWAYWSYTKEIARRLYGSAEDGWDRIAFTNILKCNNSMGADTASSEMKQYCIDELGVIWKEIQVLQPQNVVFYTHWYYDDFIDKFRLGDGYKDITDRKYWIANGSKKMSWWHREFYQRGQLVMRMLRTSHPERQKKEGFVSRITEWLQASGVAF